jgi:Tfp pilus assembly protein PilO
MKTTSNARSLVLLTALGAIVIIAAAWLLLISPTLANASEANAQAAQQESANANTEVEVNKLRQQYANIDEYQSQLTTLQQQIPTDPGYADLQRLFAAVAEENSVVITSLEFGSALELETSNVAEDGEADDSAVTTDPEAEGGSAPADGDSTGTTAAGNLYGIPVSISVLGKYDDVMNTLKELQTMDGRIVLITNVTLSTATAPAPGDKSETTGADTTGVFAGQVFVLTSSTPDEPVPDASGTDTSPSPSPAP